MYKLNCLNLVRVSAYFLRVFQRKFTCQSELQSLNIQCTANTCSMNFGNATAGNGW